MGFSAATVFSPHTCKRERGIYEGLEAYQITPDQEKYKMFTDLYRQIGIFLKPFLKGKILRSGE